MNGNIPQILRVNWITICRTDGFERYFVKYEAGQTILEPLGPLFRGHAPKLAFPASASKLGSKLDAGPVCVERARDSPVARSGRVALPTLRAPWYAPEGCAPAPWLS